MRVAIMGAGGQLGRQLVRSLADHDVVALTRHDCDICDGPSVCRRLEQIAPTVVVNAAAFTRVDECEDHVTAAFATNAYGVRTLASVCTALGTVLMHISTDYIFSGVQGTPYDEDDPPSPLNVYGVSKVAGEYFVQSICPRHFIVRTSGLYGHLAPSGGANFVETMLALARAGKKIRVVGDQVMSPTYAKDLADILGRLAQTHAYGVYHVTNGGQCSWYQFAERIFALAGVSPDLIRITAAEFGAKARRPRYSVLGHRRLVGLGFPELRRWDDALAAYLEECAAKTRETVSC